MLWRWTVRDEVLFFFFFQAEDGIRDLTVTGVQTCALPILLESLGIGVGDMLLLGDAQLRVVRIISIEPDRGAGFMNFAPRVMITSADLAATGLVQPASRITYRLAVAGAGDGSESAVQRYRIWAEQQAKAPGVHGVRVESLDSGRPEMRQTLDRAEKFLSLVALLAALLSAVAVALAAREIGRAHV